MYDTVEGLRKALLNVRTFTHEGIRYSEVANQQTVEKLRVVLNHPTIHILWLEEPKDVSRLLLQAAKHLLTMPDLNDRAQYTEFVHVWWGTGTEDERSEEVEALSRTALRGIAPDYIAEAMEQYIEANRFRTY